MSDVSRRWLSAGHHRPSSPTLRAILDEHNAVEERPDGLYATSDRLLAQRDCWEAAFTSPTLNDAAQFKPTE